MFKKIIVLFCVLILSGCSIFDDQILENFLETDTCFMYARQQLDERQQLNYDKIYNSLMLRRDAVDITSDDASDALTTYTAVFDDHPELYFSNTSMHHRVNKNRKSTITLFPTYTYDEEETAIYEEQLNTVTNEILEGIDMTASDFDKVKYVYDYVINSTEYVSKAQDDQNILSVLLNKQSVCAGYAKSMQYLLSRLQIPCAYLTGDALRENIIGTSNRHAWNMILMDQEYYYADATYGDQKDEKGSYIDYAYLGITSEEMLQLYEPDSAYEVSSATANNYFVKMDAYFSGYDEAKLLRLIKESSVNKIIFKCDSKETYHSMKAQLLDNYRIFYMLWRYGISTENLRYREWPEVNVIDFVY